MKINTDEIEVKFKFKNDEKTVATVIITIGQFEIRGFRVMKSKFSDAGERFTLFPPAIKAGPRYVDIVRMADKQDWEIFKKMILKRFDQEHSEHLINEMKKTNDNIDF